MSDDVDNFLASLGEFDAGRLQSTIAATQLVEDDVLPSMPSVGRRPRAAGTDGPRAAGTASRNASARTGSARPASQSQPAAASGSSRRPNETAEERAARHAAREARHKERDERREQRRAEKQRVKQERDAEREQRLSDASTQAARRSRTEGQWGCPICTFVNDSSSESCNGCQFARGGDCWGCKSCSFINGSDNACRQCGGLRSEVEVSVESLMATDTSVELLPPPLEQPRSHPHVAVLVDDDDEDELPAVPPSQVLRADDGDDSDDVSDDDESELSDGDDSDIDSNASWSGFDSESTIGDDDADERADDNKRAFRAEDLVSQLQLGHEDLEPAAPPATFRPNALKHFQLQGLRWMVDRELPKNDFRGGVIADLMGLGKTRSIIALCEATRVQDMDQLRRSRVRSRATLIVCPINVMTQWVKEISTCVVNPRRVLRFHGTSGRKKDIFRLAEDYDYILTTFQTLGYEYRHQSAARPSKLHMIHWFRVVLDEAHYIKNPRTRISRGCTALTGDRKWAMTATPLHNTVNDFHPICRFLDVPGFGDRQWWIQNICSEPVIGLKRLRCLMASLLLRRTYETKGQDGEPIVLLPTKTVEDVAVKLSEEEADFYEVIHKNAQAKLDGIVRRNTRLQVYSSAFAMLVRCRQAACHPNIVIAALQRKHGVDPAAAQAQTQTAQPAAAAGGPTAEEVEAEARRRLDAFVRKLKAKMKDNAYGDTVLATLVEKAGKLDEDCIICMDALVKPALLPCAHAFCTECIQSAIEVTSKCPVCKRPCKTKDISVVPERSDDSNSSNNLPGAGRKWGPGADAQAATDKEILETPLPPVGEWFMSSKVKAVLDIVRNANTDDKVLVLSHFVTFLNVLQPQLERAGITTTQYNGTLNVKQRDAVLKSFTYPHTAPTDDAAPTRPSTDEAAAASPEGAPGAADPAPPRPVRRSTRLGPRVLLASIQSCGVGLNLISANHCIIAEPSWNPAVEQQAFNRVHRIGQTKPVRVYRLLAPDTIDIAVDKLAQTKKEIADMCLDASSARRLSQNEILELFALGTGRNRRRPQTGDPDDAADSDADATPHGSGSPHTANAAN